MDKQRTPNEEIRDTLVILGDPVARIHEWFCNKFHKKTVSQALGLTHFKYYEDSKKTEYLIEAALPAKHHYRDALLHGEKYIGIFTEIATLEEAGVTPENFDSFFSRP